MGLRWTNKGWKADNKVQALGSAAGAVTVADDVRVVTATLTAATTFTLPTAVADRAIDFVLTQGTGGTKTATFTGAKAAGGAVAALSTAQGAVDVLTARCYDGALWVVTLKEKGVA